MSKKYTAFIGIGSNRNNRKENCETAVRIIASHKDTAIIKKSSLYETEAWGEESQDNFINCVAEIKTGKNVFDFFSLLQQTENKIGKQKEGFWGPRNIDIDLLFFGQEIINEPELKVPHPFLHLRRFVIEPLSEIAPDFIHPIINQSIKVLLKNLTDTKKVLKICC
jgi:2-amino-4-hydroxy-6-hydroxymethyldihydropteridine diphosphokinase